jgi:hypothetical protein
MISRLTVRQHRFVRNSEMAWVTGVRFEQDDTSVLVEVVPSGDEIELRAHGPENKALLSVISSDLDALNDSFKGLREKVDKRIPCSCKSCSSELFPSFFGYRDMVRRKQHGRLNVECPISFENVNVLHLLDGVRTEPLPAWAGDAARVENRRLIRIFVASSSELREDRDAFHLHFGQLNDDFLKEGIYLKLVRWEHFLDAISETRMQDEYNQAVRDCDLFVCLFFTKAGNFTCEEFQVAWEHYKATGKSLIYTYIENAAVNTPDWRPDDYASLKELKANLRALGHFPSEYTSIEGLNLHFSGQLPMIRQKLHL